MLTHDLYRDTGRARDALRLIGAVREGRLDERPEAAGCLEERTGPVPILNIGRMCKEQQRPPVRVHERVALAALHLLSGVIASGTAALGGLDRLAVDDRRARACLAPDPLAI